MARIKGDRAYRRKLRSLSGQDKSFIGSAVFAAAGLIGAEARLSITRGSRSGDGHVPSAPGEPPNRDTGQLDQSIVEVKTGGLKAEVQADAPHAIPLEFGAPAANLEERPFMRPAAKSEGPKAKRLIRDAINTKIRSS